MFVALERDADGYPPWDEEEIWAIPAGERLFRLDAVPTFACGLSHRDVVSVRAVAQRWYVDSLVEPHGHSTVRVVLFDDARHDTLMALGNRHGVHVDHTPVPGLFAIDIPPDKPFGEIVADLQGGLDRHWWDYEECAVSQAHDRGSGAPDEPPS